MRKSAKAAFKMILKNKIRNFGYWSDEVKEFNDKMQSKLEYHIWLNWHDEAIGDLKAKNLF